MKNLKIGMLSKRTSGFVDKMVKYLESCGHSVKIFLEDNLVIDYTLLDNDFYILKSKQLIYLYAAYFLSSIKIPVIPETKVSHLCKNRIDSHFALLKNGFLTPKVYMGLAKSIKSQLKNSEFPLVQKRIMSSGSVGVQIISSLNDLNLNSDKVLYFERYIEGKHYLVYFIEDEICICKKKPLVNEHQRVKIINDDHEIRELALKWKSVNNLTFGHLDLIRESSSNNLYIVDVGTFPEFSNWKGRIDSVKTISNLILKNYYTIKGINGE